MLMHTHTHHYTCKLDTYICTYFGEKIDIRNSRLIEVITDDDVPYDDVMKQTVTVDVFVCESKTEHSQASVMCERNGQNEFTITYDLFIFFFV